MNIESMRTRPYRSFEVDDAELSEQARGRLLAIRRFEALRAAGCAEQAALEEIGVSRRTVFRWKAALAARGQRGLEPESTRPRRVRRPSYRPGDAKAVMDLRRKHPFMGKAPIQRMLERKGRRLSVSTVGRILSRAIADGRVPRASVCEGRLRPRRRRKFNGWAQRWKYGARPRRPGQLVQIDHMTFSRDGQTIKEVPADSSSPRRLSAQPLHGRPRLLPRHRLQRQALPRRRCRSPSRALAVRPGRRRQRVHAPFMALRASRTPAGSSASNSTSCRRAARSGTAASNAPTEPPASSSGTSSTANSPSRPSPPGSSSTSSSTTTSGPIPPSTTSPPASTLSLRRLPSPSARSSEPVNQLNQSAISAKSRSRMGRGLAGR